MSDPRPIGVFDSGVGGLTVLREIIRRTPLEPTLYLGDNDRAPYGTRSDDEVLAFSTQSLDALVERDVKALVVACNTSTAVEVLQATTTAFTSRSTSASIDSVENARTSSSERVPYGARALSPR